VHQWVRSTGASLYRSTGDVFDNFVSFTTNSLSQLGNFCYSGPGCFNDIDMLTVGMYGKGNVGTQGCTYTDYVTQFSLWCFLGAPLMLGCDVRNMPPEIQKLVTNKELIRIDQDPECSPAYDVRTLAFSPINGRALFRHLSGNEYALGLFNFEDEENPIHASTHRMGFSPDCGLSVVLTDVMTGEEFGPEPDVFCFNIEAHGCRIFRARAVKL
jgi:alpha-galactosidase